VSSTCTNSTFLTTDQWRPDGHNVSNKLWRSKSRWKTENQLERNVRTLRTNLINRSYELSTMVEWDAQRTSPRSFHCRANVTNLSPVVSKCWFVNCSNISFELIFRFSPRFDRHQFVSRHCGHRVAIVRVRKVDWSHVTTQFVMIFNYDKIKNEIDETTLTKWKKN